jgi:predicted outer membrane repeat protein
LARIFDIHQQKDEITFVLWIFAEMPERKSCWEREKMNSRTHIGTWLPTTLFLLAMGCTSLAAEVIYVDADATGANDGSSWENAYTFLQDALADAKLAENPVEIRVAQGIYKPDQRMLQTPGDGDNTFTLVNEVTVKGGYAGFGEPSSNARNWDLYKSILSGDLNGDDIVVDDPCDMLLVQSNRGENSSVVVIANHTDATAVLDGFVITGGFFMHAYTGPPNGGAGMHIYQGSPTIRNCTFTGNAARQIGGGLLNRGASNPTLINCKFRGNYAESGGGIYNKPNIPTAGMMSEGSHPTLVNCTFDNNCALKNGGGMYNFLSDPTLTECTFRHNQVIGPYSGSERGTHSGGGGGMYNSNSSPVLTNCLFSENSAGDGGGICSVVDSNVTLTNCTFNGNSASVRGGGLSNREDCNLTLTNCRFINNTVTGRGGGVTNDSSNVTLVNCVFSGNKAHDRSMSSVANTVSGRGGGMWTGGNPTLINCTFCGNWASEGAGICNGGGPTLIGCTFSGNLAQNGGGMCNDGSSPELTIGNCTFSGNSAEWGGGIFYTFGARMRMANCTFMSNFAHSGNALASDPTKPSLPGYIKVNNCILWDGNNTIFDPEPYALRSAITYSNVQGGWPGAGNIDADPCFADPGYWADANDPNVAVEPNDPNAVWIDGDYHLKSQAGRWDPNSGTWVRDDVTSPCIDAADPNSPIGHEPFPNGGIINMGAYGGTARASKSYFGEPICETIVAGDVNGDCKVDFNDLILMAAHWLQDNNP